MPERALVLVVGAGRSGTSSFAGAMNHLGFYVPPPVVNSSKANPRGHFEPRWAVKFHNRILEQAGYGLVDGDPLAADHILKTARSGGYQTELRDWLAEVPESESQVIVKDPRSVWIAPIWDEVATELGMRVVYVTMLRDPAGVVGSHSEHYHNAGGANKQMRKQTAVLAGWINLNLVAEEVSRGKARKGIVYDDLLRDWRATLAPLSTTLGLSLDLSADGAAAAEVDQFLDPSLHRVHTTWEGSRIPEALRDLADALWADLRAGVHGEVDEATYIERIHEHRSTFTKLYTASEMIVRDRTRRAVRSARQDGYNAALERIRSDVHGRSARSRLIRVLRAVGRRARPSR